MKKNPVLLTTGIGSVPFIRGDNFCQKVFRDWDIPFWPQYPARSLRENMLFQFIGRFPGLEVSDAAATFHESVFEKKAAAYEKELKQCFLKNDFSSFQPTAEWALGYFELLNLMEENLFPEKQTIKLQMTGTATVWQCFFKDKVTTKSRLRVQDDLLQTLIATGLAQIQMLNRYERIPFIFIDEPVLSEENSSIAKMVETFKRFHAKVGLHVCSQLDWRNFNGLDLDFFHFDVTTHKNLNESHILFLRNFLKSGNRVVWGVTPTSNKLVLKPENVLPIIHNWLDKISDSTLSVRGILAQSLLAPACGMGGFSEAQYDAVCESMKMIKKSLDSCRRRSILRK